MRTMHHTANGIQWLLTRGKKAVGKLTLQMCRGTMEDLEARHLYEGTILLFNFILTFFLT
jgi:hypothetical protein